VLLVKLIYQIDIEGFGVEMIALDVVNLQIRTQHAHLVMHVSFKDFKV
jgi:hypothetical protein